MIDTHEIMITVKIPDGWSIEDANKYIKANEINIEAGIRRALINELKSGVLKGIKFNIKICQYGN
jgi:hypothetical protein